VSAHAPERALRLGPGDGPAPQAAAGDIRLHASTSGERLAEARGPARLVFFSHTYPTNRVEGWKAPELRVLQRFFSDIVVAPLFDGGHPPAPDFPAGVRLLPAIFGRDGWSFSRSRIADIAGMRLPRHLATLPRPPFADATARLRRWLHSRVKVEAILRSDVFRNAVAPELDGSCLYFYWGADYAEILPYLTQRHQRASLVRFHGYDLYWERNDGYMPSQRAIVESAAVLAPISEDGAIYLSRKYPRHAHKIRRHRLGTTLAGRSLPSRDGVLRIATCSYATPVKRLHLLVEGLRHVARPVEWTHIGDGPLLPSLVEASRTLPANVRCRFPGHRQPADIAPLYAAHPFDVFANVSESEGISIAIMEAMAAGIPTVATDVGGTSELVDATVGRLLRPDFAPAELAAALEAVADDPAHGAMRDRCRARVAADFDLNVNSERMGRTLAALHAASVGAAAGAAALNETTGMQPARRTS
jgi:glycosyltransferase involved in cell wall biosynthesis